MSLPCHDNSRPLDPDQSPACTLEAEAIAAFGPRHRMSAADYDRAREERRRRYGDSDAEAAARRDQAEIIAKITPIILEPPL